MQKTHAVAVGRMLEALGDQPKASAVVALVQGLASLLDADPNADAEIWREYRMALKTLMEVAGGGDIDDNVRDLIDRMGNSSSRNPAD